MTNKYNQKLIWEYINGEEIPNIDKLEKDYQFLMQVIKTSKDKNMYKLCSKEIKENYQFIKFIIETFKSDEEFITKIADDYLKKFGEETLESKELIFLMCELLNKNSNDFEKDSISFYLKRSLIYTTERILIETFLKENEYAKEEIGLGFACVYYDELGASEIITNYFAKMYLNEIFYNNKFSLEELVHKHFKTLSDLKEVEIKQYILNYVSYFDKYLADYLANHLFLIEKLEKSINNIIMNWKNFLERDIKRKNDEFEDKTIKILEKNNVEFDYNDVCYQLDKMNLNLPIKLFAQEYYKSLMEDYEEFIDVISNIDMNNINNYKCIQEIVFLAKKIYIEEPNELLLDKRVFVTYPINNKKLENTKILSFKPNKKYKNN